MTSQLPSGTSEESHPSSDRHGEQDLWIQLYDQLLWTATHLRMNPVVFQNHVEAHERFCAYFGISIDLTGSSNIVEGAPSPEDRLEARSKSFNEFSGRRERLMTGMRWRLQETMKCRLQRGGHLEIRGLVIEPWMLEEYKEICNDVEIGKDASYPEDYPELWSFLQEIVQTQVRRLLCPRFKFDWSRTVQVQCMAELDGGGRCEQKDTMTVSELLQNDPWRTCDLHRGRALPTSPSRPLVLGVVDEEGNKQINATAKNEGDREQLQ